MNKQEVILTIGLPGSGKSTWAREQIKNNTNYKIVCRDDLRSMLDNGVWNPKNEYLVKKLQHSMIKTILENGNSVIVADTNLNETTRKELYNTVDYVSRTMNTSIPVVEKSFLDVPVEECIRRDLARPNSVGSKVILDMASRMKYEQKIPVYDYDLPKAYIVDIDGTIAFMNGRKPYDWNKVDTDLPNVCVINTIQQLSRDCKILITSGRDSVCKEKTIEWLDKHGVPYDNVFMRSKGDMRKDYIVKKELYEQNIKDKYAVIGVFDDRPAVVRLWKELGLMVFNVGNDYEF